MRKRGEYKGGVTQGVYGGREEGGREGWGGGEERRRSSPTSVEVFVYVFDGFVNKSEISQKKVSRIFGF